MRTYRLFPLLLLAACRSGPNVSEKDRKLAETIRDMMKMGPPPCCDDNIFEKAAARWMKRALTLLLIALLLTRVPGGILNAHSASD